MLTTDQHSLLWEYPKGFLWMLLFAMLVATWFFLKRLPAWFRSVRGACWPMVEGRIESAKVITFAEQSLAQLAYSYLVEGERYAGYFARQFADEQDAWDYVRPLQGQPIFVRYQSAKPSVSAIRASDQNILFGAEKGNFLARFLVSATAHLVGESDWDFLKWLGVRNWPLSKGRIESGTITQKRERELWYLLTYYVCEIGYSYAVSGEYYSGCFARTFFRERSAQRFTDELKGKDIFVRYRPDSPAVSALRIQDQQGMRLA